MAIPPRPNANVILENIDINMDFLENIDIDKGILQNIEIDETSPQAKRHKPSLL